MLCQSSSNQMQIISSLNMYPLPHLQLSPLGEITVIPGVHFSLIYKKPGDGCTYNDPSKVILRFSLSWTVIHPLAGSSKMFCSVSFWQLETLPLQPHPLTQSQFYSAPCPVSWAFCYYCTFHISLLNSSFARKCWPKGKTRSLATPCTCLEIVE